MGADATYLVAGFCVLLAVVLPTLLDRWAVSAPMVLVGVGLLLGATPLTDGLLGDADRTRPAVEHLTELTVIVALMGVGLALNRPLSWRDRSTWRSWSAVFRLLGIGMPLSILAVAVLGVTVGGLGVATALLLGATLAPTDPVLASDIQVGRPVTRASSDDEEPAAHDDDDVSFALTAEAGLNDGLAFPFVYLAIALGAGASGFVEIGLDVAWYVVGKTVLGVLGGLLVGQGLTWLVFGGRLRLAERNQPLIAVTGVLLAYGVAEVAGGYGFLAVFVAALTIRSAERTHEFQSAMHSVVERLEVLLTLAVLLVLGVAMSRGLLAALDWRGALIGVALVALVRPLSGLAALVGSRRAEGEPWCRAERGAIAFLGVRGVGSLYYLSYATGQTEWDDKPWLWATVSFTVVLSVFVHGVSAKPILRWVERSTASRVTA